MFKLPFFSKKKEIVPVVELGNDDLPYIASIDDAEPPAYSFNDWVKEFNVSSKFTLDTDAEEEEKEILQESARRIKELKIRAATKYCRTTQNFTTA